MRGRIIAKRSLLRFPPRIDDREANSRGDLHFESGRVSFDARDRAWSSTAEDTSEESTVYAERSFPHPAPRAPLSPPDRGEGLSVDRGAAKAADVGRVGKIRPSRLHGVQVR